MLSRGIGINNRYYWSNRKLIDMGRVIIDQYDYHRNVKRISLKCKSEERAFEIQAKLPNVKQWQYFEGSARLANLKRRRTEPQQPSLNDMAVLAGLMTRQEAEELNPTK